MKRAKQISLGFIFCVYFIFLPLKALCDKSFFNLFFRNLNSDYRFWKKSWNRIVLEKKEKKKSRINCPLPYHYETFIEE